MWHSRNELLSLAEAIINVEAENAELRQKVVVTESGLRLSVSTSEAALATCKELRQKVSDANEWIDKIISDDEWWEEVGLTPYDGDVRRALRDAREASNE
jgi:hypothetical protein